ncbi:PQQ-dependent sugar dehydrogenase [Micrococcales bacterium 31B]|nr:PQQ-dependent sugar dehydrogenase [Micrococcales bacterium 31B]
MQRTPRTRTQRIAGFGLLTCTLLSACVRADPEIGTPVEVPAALEVTATPLGEVEVMATGLDAPWSVAFVGDGIVVSERDTARIVEVNRSGEVREVGVIAGVKAFGEAGLLGIAARGRFLYVYSTGADSNRIERYELTGEPGALQLGAGRTLLDGIPKAGFHDGGRLAFGPDGMLYATTGDAGRRPEAQSLTSFAGKILRMTPDGEVPADNPFEGSYVYSYGHRNSQGIAWGADGTMYAAEFGQNTWDELNVIEAGGNYGWPEVEGIAHAADFIDPVQQWRPADASPSGLAVTDDSIWIANLRGQRLREIPVNELNAFSEHYVREYGRLRDVTVGPDGALWVLTNNTDGRGGAGPDDDRLLRIAR